MNSDGTGQTRLTSDPANDTAPTWSSDRTKIAFISSRRGHSFDYTVSDGSLNGTTAVSISINPTNDPPVAGDDSATVDEGGLVAIDLTGNDTDVDGNFRFATIVIASRPANGSLVVNGNRIGTGTGTVTYTHDDSETTNDSFSYKVNDNDGATSN